MVFRLVAPLVCLFLLRPTLAASDWTLVRYEGRDHVTLQNVANFYQLAKFRRGGKGFTMGSGSRRLSGRLGSRDLYINGIKFILSYPISKSQDDWLLSRMDLSKLVEPVLRPSRIREAGDFNTIVLDPGHGGHDHGARGRWGSEKKFTLDVAKRAKDLLMRQGYKVRMTRVGDYFVSLEDRVKYANRYSKAIFVSVHFNSGPRYAAGLETYTLAPRGVPSTASRRPSVSDLRRCIANARDPENMALATASHAAVLQKLGVNDRGIKRARFVVLKDILIPGVLVEGGFITNRSESRKIASTAYRQQLAFGIAEAVRNYKTAISARRPSTIAADTPSIPGRRELAELLRIPPERPRRSSGPRVDIPTTP